MQSSLRDRFRLLPKLFWGIVAGAFAIYSVLRDSVLKDLSPSGSLAIVSACVLTAALAAIIISALRPTSREKEEGALSHYAKSIEEFDSGNYSLALSEALEAVREDPSRPVHWSRVGRSALRLGDIDIAIEHFTKAIELDKSRENRSTHFHNRGIGFYLKGNHMRAEQDLLDSLGITPRSPVTLYHLAVNAIAMGDTDAACLYAQRSVSIDRPAALAIQSAALASAGRKRIAKETLAQSLDLDLRTAVDHYYIAAAHVSLGDLESAKSELRLAVQKDPKYQEWYVHDTLFVMFGNKSERMLLVSNNFLSPHETN
jgi:tetratricopeptide (TPR) repeat protein